MKPSNVFEPSEYQLIDFGDGQKLESYASVPVVRDCPAARHIRPCGPLKQAIRSKQLCYRRDEAAWANIDLAPSRWCVRHRDIRFQLKPTPFGHLGLFSEQAANWDWIDSLAWDLSGLRALNLFAYTGGASLSLARLGVRVVHLDSARNTVGWAKQNAELSGLKSAPVRWIVDDALAFCRREIKRGNQYEILIADPPTIGHGGKRLTWKLDRDFHTLLELFNNLLAPHPTMVLLTCHTEGFNGDELRALVAQHMSLASDGLNESGPLFVKCQFDRELNCGHYFRWHRGSVKQTQFA